MWGGGGRGGGRDGFAGRFWRFLGKCGVFSEDYQDVGGVWGDVFEPPRHQDTKEGEGKSEEKRVKSEKAGGFAE